MPGHTELTGLALVAVAALACGILLTRFRQPAIVGYILAGILLGPSGLALVEDRSLISALAELGVLMLLFVIGMELSLRALARVWQLALFATVLQIIVSVGVMLILSRLLGWTSALAILLGFVVAVSSTTVAIKILEDIGELRTHTGRLAVGILIVQDLAIVPMMLVIDSTAPDSEFDLGAIAVIVVAVSLLAVFIRYLTRRRRVSLPFGQWIDGSLDLRALTGLAFCFGASALSGFVGLSEAFGAFFAGLVIGNSSERVAMLNATKPVQSVLLMMFFLSVGLLIDLSFIWRELGTVLLLLLFVTVLKTALNVVILHALGTRWYRAFLAGTVLGQVGEFSFVLVAAGVAAGTIGADAERLMVAVIALSLMISPLWLLTARRAHGFAATSFSSLGQLLGEVYGNEKALADRTSSWVLRRSTGLFLQTTVTGWFRQIELSLGNGKGGRTYIVLVRVVADRVKTTGFHFLERLVVVCISAIKGTYHRLLARTARGSLTGEVVTDNDEIGLHGEIIPPSSSQDSKDD
mgnify:CR=1 FL=1